MNDSQWLELPLSRTFFMFQKVFEPLKFDLHGNKKHIRRITSNIENIRNIVYQILTRLDVDSKKIEDFLLTRASFLKKQKEEKTKYLQICLWSYLRAEHVG